MILLSQTIRLYRNAYRGLPRSVWLLSGVMLINRCGTMVLPFLTLYMTQHLGFSVEQTGFVMLFFGAGALGGTFFGGFLTDRFGFYAVQLGSLLWGGVVLILLQFVPSFPGLCASVFVFTLFGDTFRPANNVAISSYSTPDTRARAYALNRLAINLGWSVGGGLGGYLASIDYSLLFWVDGLTCIGAAMALVVFLPAPENPRFKPAANDLNPRQAESISPGLSQGFGDEESPQLKPGANKSPYKDRYFLIFIGLTSLFAISFLQLFGMFPLYCRQVLHLNEANIGLLMTLNGLLIVAVEMVLVYTAEARNWPRLTVMRIGVMLTGLSYLLLNSTGWVGIVVVSVLVNTFGEMLAMPFMQTWAAARANDQYRGQYMALYSMTYAVAQVVAPLLGSQITQRAGFVVLWWVIGGIAAVSAGGFFVSERVKE
jgi:predicted MFS family arabinose efflux permease